MMVEGDPSVVILEAGPFKFEASCKTITYDNNYYYSSTFSGSTSTSHSGSTSTSSPSSPSSTAYSRSVILSFFVRPFLLSVLLSCTGGGWVPWQNMYEACILSCQF